MIASAAIMRQMGSGAAFTMLAMVLGCGPAATQTDPATARPVVADPQVRETRAAPQVSQVGSFEGRILCVRALGAADWSVGTLATSFRLRRVPGSGTAPTPIAGLGDEGKTPGCAIPSPDGASVAYAVTTGAAFETHVRGLDGAGDRTIGSGVPFGWTTGGADVLVVDAAPRLPARRIVAIPAAGGAPRTVVELPADRMVALGAGVSPDGTQVTFGSAPQANPAAGDVHVVPVSGGDPLALTTDGQGSREPAFTSDGRGVVFVSRRGGDADLWVVPTSGGEPIAVLQTPGVESAPASSLDGATLVFGWRPEAPSVVTFRTPANAAAQSLAGTADDVTRVALSSDGTRVAFARGVGTETDLLLQSLAGREARAIATLPGMDTAPAFSPDNNSIAYVSNRTGAAEIWLLPVAGGEARRLTDNLGVLPRGRLVFSPDGQRLAFLRTKDSGPTLSILPLGGGNPTDLLANAGSWAWEAGGRTLIVGVGNEWKRVKVDGTGTPETLPWTTPFTSLLAVAGERNRAKAILLENTDGVRVIRVDLRTGGEREVLAELPRNLDPERFSVAVTPDGGTVVATEAPITTELRRISNAREVFSGLLP